MSRLEQQTTDIMNEMYDSITNDDFDSISDYTDRVSGVVDKDTDRNDKDEMPYDNDKDEMPYEYDNDQMPYEYDKDNDTAITELKNDINMINDDLNYVGTKDMVPYIRDDSMMTKVKRPDEVSRLGTGKNTKTDGQEGNKKEKPPYKKATKDIQIKTSHKKGKEAKNTKRGNTDTLLGDLLANTTKGTEKGQKDKMGKDDIGIFEFIFHGLPELPELEGVDEDRLRELQNAVQEQLHQRDEERERNITKRVQEFKKTFDFVNSHLLKGVATMAELTKTENRQPMGKIKPTDKMVMMLSLFDGTKPATSKQHYERFYLYINFQTKSGHLTDPVQEGIDLFEHTLDKTALVWFQMNRSKFKDLTVLKMMFLQRYNPWGKTKREQLQSWNILSFNPKTTDVDEHIDLINTLGDMVDQKKEAKKEKFIETMPTVIQTHLITCKD